MSDFAKFLAGADAVLGHIQTLANTPGINLLPYVSTASSAVTAIRAGVKAGVAVTPYVEAFLATFTGAPPTQIDLERLDARIAELRAKLHAPLPPREEGEPE